jgi:uncharacterized protein (DUF2062 family)
VGLSVAIGLFVGCLPLYGLHLPLCAAICVPLGLDLVLAYLAANISNPLLAPLLVFVEVELGALLLTGHGVPFDLEAARRTGVGGFVLQAALGSLVFGLVLGALGGCLAAWLAGRRETSSRKPTSTAKARVRARYRAAELADRCYVAMKLWLDPVADQLAALGALGEILDLGCGRGQLGLYLLELGAGQRVVGFDFDSRKIEVALQAANGVADFQTRDLLNTEFPAADSVLLVDVLHYLAPGEQARVLERAVASVRHGGRLIVREASRRASFGSALTRALELFATRLGYNKSAGALGFLGVDAIRDELSRAGFDCEARGSSAPGLANSLLVARRKPT